MTEYDDHTEKEIRVCTINITFDNSYIFYLFVDYWHTKPYFPHFLTFFSYCSHLRTSFQI